MTVEVRLMRLRSVVLAVVLLVARAAFAQTSGVTLTASPANWEVAPGTTVSAYAYNGTIPGPTLRYRTGDRVRVTLVNNLREPTTIHWHGVPVPNGMDGVPGISAPVVQPGSSFVYEFTAPGPGTYWYHPHANSAEQIARGLYGLLIVDPPGATPAAWDREVPLVIGEFLSAMSPFQSGGMGPGMPGMPGSVSRITVMPAGGGMMGGLLLINGKTAPAIPDVVVNRGERVLFRIVNTGNMVHPMHVHGLHWKVIATDGFDLPATYRKDTLPVNAGERYDALLDADNPGTWMVHCHNLTHVGDGPVGLVFNLVVK
jgi:FtsP/CotA-like multicopper oxidase with cupredoxin domain